MNEQVPREQGGQEVGDLNHETDPGSQPRIYVASLSDYNAGRLHGVWLDADVDAEVLAEGVQAMLAKSDEHGAEEFAIHDYEGFGPLRLGEYESLESAARIARGITEHGMEFAHWADLLGTNDAADLERFEEAYRGHFESLDDYAESLLDDVGAQAEIDKAVPEYLAPYVHLDFEGFGRDLEISGDITTSAGNGGIYVFDGTV